MKMSNELEVLKQALADLERAEAAGRELRDRRADRQVVKIFGQLQRLIRDVKRRIENDREK
jgi:hypothetical protein